MQGRQAERVRIAVGRQVGFPAGKPPARLTHKGRADQAIGYQSWQTTDYWADPQRARERGTIAGVLLLRHRRLGRRNGAADYGPFTGACFAQFL